ncbi:MAG: alpha/beta hydrolase [Spirochaetales bacterium]|jgi:pimeloyl-ACP methyl ester carboxylesterase|nr:alpha/beta hydrolase [Spirochaetales bacterium]
MKDYKPDFVSLPNGERLAYRRGGTGGETVLLIHGNMSSSVHWQTTMERLESRWTVFAPDMRGFGDSTYQAPFDSLKDLALDMGLFCDALGISRCRVVGWSTGGGVALELAAERPALVEKAALLDSVPPTGYPMFKKDAAGKPTGVSLKTKEDVAADPVQVIPALTALAKGDRAVMGAIWKALIYNLRLPDSGDYEEYISATLKQRNLVDLDYALLTFNMTGEPSLAAPGSGRLAAVQCPVTVFHGEKDLVVPLAWGQETARLLGGRARLVTFPGCGHSPITDAPELFFEALEEALS